MDYPSDSESDFELEKFPESGLSQNSSASPAKANNGTTLVKSGKVTPASSQDASNNAANDVDEEQLISIAKRKLQFIAVPDKIQSPTELCWDVSAASKQKQYLVRLAHKDEAIGLDIPKTWDESKKSLVQVISHIEKNSFYLVGNKNLKTCLGDDGDDLKAAFVKHLPRTYSSKTTALDRKIEELFIEKVLEEAVGRSKQVIEQKENEVPAPEPAVPLEVLQEPEHDTSAQVASMNVDDDDGSKKETLRAGDIIEYYINRFGVESNRHRAMVYKVTPRPKGQAPILELSNEMQSALIERETKILRVIKYYRNKHIATGNDVFKTLESFKLVGSDAPPAVRALAKTQEQRLEAILDKSTAKLKATLKDAGMENCSHMLSYGRADKKMAPVPEDAEEEDEEEDSKLPAMAPNEDVPPWKAALLEQIKTLEASKNKRRMVCHMTVEQLQLAIEVRERMEAENKSNQDIVTEADVSEFSLQYFLEGDQKKLRSKPVHEETEEKLRAWLSVKSSASIGGVLENLKRRHGEVEAAQDREKRPRST